MNILFAFRVQIKKQIMTIIMILGGKRSPGIKMLFTFILDAFYPRQE